MKQEDVIKFAKKNGYDRAEYDTKWRGYDVYLPIIDGKQDEIVCIGPPIIILVKGEKIRLSSPDEAFEYIDEMGEEEEPVTKAKTFNEIMNEK